MKAGAARTDITPPDGAMMACFPAGPERQARRAQGAHDPLTARAVCLSDGAETVALCSCDLTLIQRLDVRRVRELVGQRIPALNGPRLIIAATHTHSSPENTYLFGGSPDDPWIHEMDRRIAEAVVRAHDAMRPATIALGRARAELAHNRRILSKDGRITMAFDYDPEVTTGPSDPDAAVVRISDKNGVIAILYNFAGHALTVGPGNLLYTADYPGVACSRIEAALDGATALFLNGGGGNIHPRKSMKRGFDATEEIGAALAGAILPAVEAAEPVAEGRLRFAADTLTFPNRVAPELTVEVEVSCLTFGPLVIGVLPGEPFIEFQLRFKETLAPSLAMFVGYANGCPGYIPTREAYAEGGYGVDLFTGDPPEMSRTALPPGAGETLLERLLSLAGQLAS